MWKIISVLVIVAIIDLRKISFKEKKKEVLIYITICLITISLVIHQNNPEHLTHAELYARFFAH